MRDRYWLIAPTVGEMLISLSLSTMSIRVLRWPMSFRASRLMPVISAASPTTTTTFSFVPRRSRVSANPSAMESPVPAWPPSKMSCSLSERRGNPPMPPSWRSVPKLSSRPVSSLCVYAWWPVSQTSLSVGEFEQPMERDGQLDDPEVAAEVAAGLGNGPDDRAADLRAKRAQLLLVEVLEIARALDAGQK